MKQMHRIELDCRWVLIVGVLACFATFGSSLNANAGSYRHKCETVGKQDFTFNPNTERVRHAQSGDFAKFNFAVRPLKLRRVVGNCVSGKDLFRFRQELYGLTLNITYKGQSHRKKFFCRRLQYTTPEGRNCDREVRRINWNASRQHYREFLSPK